MNYNIKPTGADEEGAAMTDNELIDDYIRFCRSEAVRHEQIASDLRRQIFEVDKYAKGYRDTAIKLQTKKEQGNDFHR